MFRASHLIAERNLLLGTVRCIFVPKSTLKAKGKKSCKNQKYVCEKCGKQCTTQMRLSIHKCPVKETCSKCKKVFNNRHNFRTHKCTPLPCSKYGISFWNKQESRIYMRQCKVKLISQPVLSIKIKKTTHIGKCKQMGFHHSECTSDILFFIIIRF